MPVDGRRDQETSFRIVHKTFRPGGVCHMKNRFWICNLVFVTFSVAVAPAQSDARIDLPEASLTVGDSLVASVTFESPAPCPAQIGVTFAHSQDTGRGFQVLGNIAEGEKTVKLTAPIPRDFPGGEYVAASQGRMWPCPGYSDMRTFSVPARRITVKALPDTNQYPAKAELSLSVTQKKFLDTKVAELSALSGKLDTGLKENSAETPQLRTFLIGIVDSAEDALSITERQYREQILKPQDSLPAFFKDFHAQYQALRIDLRAQIPGIPRASGETVAALIYVQLKTRPPSGDLSGTFARRECSLDSNQRKHEGLFDS